MIPIIKCWLTEVGQELTSLGVQVHGGMGYIEETGAAQYLRDVRITSIYEGTNGIQAADLVGRKLARDHGGAMQVALEEVGITVALLEQHAEPALQAIGRDLGSALAGVEGSTGRLLQALRESPPQALGVAFDYLMQCGYLLGGWHLARSALVAQARLEAGVERDFYHQKIATCSFYAEQILPRCAGHAGAVAALAGSLSSYPGQWL